MTSDLSISRLRRRLAHTWRPFFGRFGNLTEVQIRTIPAVLQGHSVVVSAPTASGKTEAVVAPVAERHTAEGWPGLAVVYVVPTRALANDLFERLEDSLGENYLSALLKHGDRPTLPDREIHWLITTPESLDSLLCRRPHLFTTLRTIIIDEIHLLDSTYRGDQLRVLVARLRQTSTAPVLNVHLLSATLPNPEQLARRYTEDFQLIQVSNPRPINAHFANTHQEVLDLALRRRWRKLLYFCNTRQSVEEVAAQVKELWKPYPVVTHHGSLDRHARAEAEEVMKQNAVAVCVSTSTLEIGIDIGDIDLVVLAEPPWSLESLQQRVGRGSRRSQTIEAVAVCRTDEEQTVLQLMFAAAASGAYHSNDYKPDRSVIVQQSLSILYQARTGIPRQTLADFMKPLGTQEEVRAIINHLGDKGYCLELGDQLYPSSDLLDLGEEGKIHSNIPDQNDYQVIDADSGKPVGRIRGSFDQTFLLAGRTWKVLMVQGNQVTVRRSPHGGASASFGMQRNVGQFYYLLPPSLRDPR